MRTRQIAYTAFTAFIAIGLATATLIVGLAGQADAGVDGRRPRPTPSPSATPTPPPPPTGTTVASWNFVDGVTGWFDQVPGSTTIRVQSGYTDPGALQALNPRAQFATIPGTSYVVTGYLGGPGPFDPVVIHVDGTRVIDYVGAIQEDAGVRDGVTWRKFTARFTASVKTAEISVMGGTSSAPVLVDNVTVIRTS